ncbi:hypothetical protein B0H14DRAFT_2860214 [Mycena olivaceomarginata]|nr:hypothetical protein B0H14DRAFT_2860214 [Mycena olivaceomarginata]
MYYHPSFAAKNLACMPFMFCTTLTFTFFPFPSLPHLSPFSCSAVLGPQAAYLSLCFPFCYPHIFSPHTTETARTDLYLHRTVTDLYCSGLQR